MNPAMNPALPRGNRWLRRAGLFGFWFFLAKGLLWLAAPFFFWIAL